MIIFELRIEEKDKLYYDGNGYGLNISSKEQALLIEVVEAIKKICQKHTNNDPMIETIYVKD